jgi:signal transduction histidine kinase
MLNPENELAENHQIPVVGRPWLRIRRSTLYRVYLIGISLLGMLLTGLGILQLPAYEPRLNFILLVILTGMAAFASTSVPVSDKAGITYQIGTTTGLAAIPVFGLMAGVILTTVDALSIWFFKPKNETTWKKSGAQLAFNNGMCIISMCVSGTVLLLLRSWLGPDSLWGLTLPWLIAAAVYSEVNLWLLIGILRLQHGPQIQPLTIWKEERWATQIDAAVLALGGGVLSYAAANYNWLGVAIFFLPIALSAYAFRLYVGQMQAHMDNLEQIVQARTKDLAELNRQKDAFLAVLTHDMMTPLASIQLCAEELQVDPSAAAENPHLITMMLRSQKMLFRMVRDILDLEKLQSGGFLSTQKAPCDLAQLLTQVVEIVQPEAAVRNIALVTRLTTQPLVIHADRQQMERIFMNLIGNAIKYTPSNGKVEIQAQMNPEHVAIDIKDNGYGIPNEELPFIFERFRRVEQLKDKAVGTGLGLAITQGLVKEHQGIITVQSEVGKGSIFTVRLPVG